MFISVIYMLCRLHILDLRADSCSELYRALELLWCFDYPGASGNIAIFLWRAVEEGRNFAKGYPIERDVYGRRRMSPAEAQAKVMSDRRRGYGNR